MGMELADIQLILSKMGVDQKYLIPTREHQLMIPCPLAKWTHKKGTDHNPSCSVRFGDVDKSSMFQCFSCKESGKFAYLVHTFGSLAQDVEMERLGMQLYEKDEPTMEARLAAIAKGMDEWVHPVSSIEPRKLHNQALDNFPDAWAAVTSRQYLETDRKIDYQTCKFWDLRYHSASQRVVFPVRDKDQNLVGAVGRGIFDEVQPRYWNFFGFESGSTLGGLHMIKGHPQVGVVEGYFALIKVWPMAQQLGIDTVCTFQGKTTPEQGEMLARLDANLIYLYDYDEAGNKGWVKARSMLSQVVFGIRRAYWLPETLDIDDLNMVQFEQAIRASTTPK